MIVQRVWGSVDAIHIIYYIYIYIHTKVGPGYRGLAVTWVAKREIELHFRDVCVIPSRAHTHTRRSGWPVEMKFPVLSPHNVRVYMYKHTYNRGVCGYVRTRATEFTVAWMEKKRTKEKTSPKRINKKKILKPRERGGGGNEEREENVEYFYYFYYFYA